MAVEELHEDRAPGVLRRVLQDLGEGRRRLEDIDLRRTWQVLAGVVLISLGVLALLLGYAGAARTPFVEEQIPYLISGGLLGLGMLILGGLFFWAHWLYRHYERSEFHQAEMRRLLEELVSQGRSLAEGATVIDEEAALVVAEGASTVHRPTCGVVASMNSPRTVTPDAARRSGFRRCRLCEPLLPDIAAPP